MTDLVNTLVDIVETMSNLFKLKILNKEISLIDLFLSKYGKITIKDDSTNTNLIGNL